MELDPQSSPVTFRPMELEDIPYVYALDVMSFSMPWSERSYRFELVENQNSICWVAQVTSPDDPSGVRAKIVGMIVIWAILDEAHVATIAVNPDYRGQGIGRRLLAIGLQAAYQRGARMAFLEVRRSNTVAQGLYQRFGFQVVNERLRYYQDNHEDALLMTLEQLQPEELLALAV